MPYALSASWPLADCVLSCCSACTSAARWSQECPWRPFPQCRQQVRYPVATSAHSVTTRDGCEAAEHSPGIPSTCDMEFTHVRHCAAHTVSYTSHRRGTLTTVSQNSDHASYGTETYILSRTCHVSIAVVASRKPPCNQL